MFSLKTITAAIRLVVVGLLSLRGAASCFRIFDKWFQGGQPCHVVIQNWILRLGLYRLRQGARRLTDWVYILDHTIEFGTKKCLLILGITLEQFLANKCVIRHQDVKVLAIRITEKADASSVDEALRDTAKRTGVPVQILSDYAANLIYGVRRFSKEVESTDENCKVIHSHDVTHRAALIIERQLRDDGHWKRFAARVCDTKRCLIHTPLGYLAPPKPRDKARWANLDIYLNWAEVALGWRPEGRPKAEQEKFNDKLSWLREFKPHLEEWRAMLDILEALKREVKANGLSKMTKGAFENATAGIKLQTPRLAAVMNEAMAYINKECAELSGVYPGCSDIIESVFGKYKLFSGKSPMKEIGKSVLTIPAFTGKIDYAEVKEAMESVSAADVKEWMEENIGVSLFSKRKKEFHRRKTKKPVKNITKNMGKAASF